MVTDRQVRRLFQMKNKVDRLYQAADLAGMSVKTARKYLQSGQLPSQCKPEHTWKTHEDAFGPDWPWLKDFLETNSGIEAKSLFEHLQRERPGRYTDKQLRTFQRRIKHSQGNLFPADLPSRPMGRIRLYQYELCGHNH